MYVRVCVCARLHWKLFTWLVLQILVLSATARLTCESDFLLLLFEKNNLRARRRPTPPTLLLLSRGFVDETRNAPHLVEQRARTLIQKRKNTAKGFIEAVCGLKMLLRSESDCFALKKYRIE